MSRRKLFLAIALSIGVCGASVIALLIASQKKARQAFERGIGLLHPPCTRVLALASIDAEGALLAFEEAMEAGLEGAEVRGFYHYALALLDFQRGDLRMAEEELASAFRYLGEHPDLALLAAQLSHERGRFQNAEREIQHALRLKPAHPLALALAIEIAQSAGDIGKAQVHLHALRSLGCQGQALGHREALLFEARGELEQAERKWLDLTGRAPDDLIAWINLARILHLRGKVEEALRAYDKALSIESNHPHAHLGRGLVHRDLGEHRKAEEDFKKASSLAPRDPKPWIALGDLKREEGDIAKAIECYRVALDLDSGQALAWLKMGNALVASGEYFEASQAFLRALHIAPSLGQAHNGLGVALMHLAGLDDGYPSKALFHLERAAELNPEDPNPLVNIALLAEREGLLMEARKRWQLVLARWPRLKVAVEHLERIDEMVDKKKGRARDPI